jgi:DNA-binding GntR family transcriptional regulator
VQYHHPGEPPQLYPGSGHREQAELLQVPQNSLLLRVQSISYAHNNTIVDLSDIYQNTNKYNVKHITPPLNTAGYG